jgi:hypothetical protein
MTKFSMHKISLAAMSGVAVFMLVASAAAPADAAIGSSKFRATPEELRRHCWRIDVTFWMSKRRYGCGEVVACVAGKCLVKYAPPPPPPPPPPLLTRKGDGGNGGGGSPGVGDHGNKGGRQSSSATGGPN